MLKISVWEKDRQGKGHDTREWEKTEREGTGCMRKGKDTERQGEDA